MKAHKLLGVGLMVFFTGSALGQPNALEYMQKLAKLDVNIRERVVCGDPAHPERGLKAAEIVVTDPVAAKQYFDDDTCFVFTDDFNPTFSGLGMILVGPHGAYLVAQMSMSDSDEESYVVIPYTLLVS